MIEQQTFNNRYRLDSKLGEGGMATVYCGTDTLLRRRVAIKVLRPQYAADDEFVRRFYQEAESAARLSHPNIVNTYDVGREKDIYYIVMELVDGSTLAEIIATDGKLPEPVAIDYAAQICSGLAYAHRQGLLHRDVKPANILVTKDDVCKLSDFGIARAVSQHTMTLTKPGLVMGSVFYISPEQAQGHDLHEASDLYSVGVVLYQMLTGELPYKGESPVTVALKHIGDPVPTLENQGLGISPALTAIVNKLLQKKPANRFQSASDVASALREARERPSVAAYRIQNDAPTQMFEAQSLPPRRSPLPDTYSSLGEDAAYRSRRGTGLILWLAFALLLAVGAGYLVFARPSLPSLVATVSVGDYTNMTDAAAEQSIVNAGLVARFIKSSSDTVAANHVIRQNPPPGTKAEKNSVIELLVSNGLPLVGLRDVRSYSASDAKRTLEGDQFKVKLISRFDNAPKDSVIDETPMPGTPVRRESIVTLIVSDGPKPIVVPNFVGMTTAGAQALAQQDGISLDLSDHETISGIAADTVASQDVAQGQTIDRATTVHAVVSNGEAESPAASLTQVAVPDVVTTNNDYNSAIHSLQAAGFIVQERCEIQSSANGTIIAEDPAAGTQAASGSTVTVTISVSGEVPDTEGDTMTVALSSLASYCYKVGNIKYTSLEGSDGHVVRTEPSAGTTLATGSSVTLIVNGP